MTTNLYPLRFKPVYKDYIWGGDNIIRTFNRPMPPGIYAESWEVSDHPDGMSVVENGPWAHQTFRQILEREGARILGPKVAGTKFPLLVKLIDSKDRLSVQVHPNDTTAAQYGGEAKTEMWYILGGEPDAKVYAGLTEGTDKAEFEEALRTSRFEDILVSIPVHPGDAVFMPGGRVHAIDAGCLILEVQQNSNTTYRVYDWNRVGPDGQPRALHVKQALQVIRWDDNEDARALPVRMSAPEGNELWQVVTSPYFVMERMQVNRPWLTRVDGSTFHILFISEGQVRIQAEDFTEQAGPGTSYLIPAGLPRYTILPDSSATILRVTLP